MVDQIHGEYQFMRSNGFARRAGLRARSTEKAGRDSSADRAQFFTYSGKNNFKKAAAWLQPPQ